jgi:glycosyltransferase involved in cell wall biosynthesis
MRVAFDTNALYTTQAGVARYVRGLQSGFAALNRPDLAITELAWKVENFGYRQPARALKTFYREFVWTKFVAPGLLRQQKPDLLHSLSGFFVRPPAPTKNVVTLHDLAPMRFPERFRTWQRLARRWRFPALQQADAIICVSEFTANEAISLLALPARKLHVVHSGLDIDRMKTREENFDFAVPSEFFLFVGSLEPGKNLSLLRDVYLLGNAQKKTLPPLLIVGARWEGVPQEGMAPPNWRYLGRQADDVLFELYRRARALVFPSKYEGFGFPILEAQANGCPVICSRVASLPEIGGSGALYAELTPESYLRAMEEIRPDGALRSQLIASGRENSAKFSWKKCAARTADIYEAVATATWLTV